MSGRPLAVLVESVHATADGPLREAGFEVERLAGSPDAATLASLVTRATVLGLRSKTRLPKALLEQADALAAVGPEAGNGERRHRTHSTAVDRTSPSPGQAAERWLWMRHTLVREL